jgi:Dullard-like phosphatase family protein
MEWENESILLTERGNSPGFKDKLKLMEEKCYKNKEDFNEHVRPNMEKIKPKLIPDTHSTIMAYESLTDHSISIRSDIEKDLMDQISEIRLYKQVINNIKNEYRTTDTSILHGKKILVLGMSKTLIMRGHTTDIKIYLKRKKKTVFVSLRPSVQYFLYIMSCFYDIVVFSEYSNEFTKAVLNIIDEHKSIKTIYTRKHCDRIDCKKYAKDLRRVTTDFKSVVFVDSNLLSFSLQPSNGLYIAPYEGSATDKTLKDLGQYLIEISECEDVRAALKLKFKYIDFLLQI